MELLGVPAETVVRIGGVRAEIVSEMQSGEHDLLVLGAPLTYRQGEVTLEGLVGQVIKDMTAHPVLIVRSRYATSKSHPRTDDGRINIFEKIIP